MRPALHLGIAAVLLVSFGQAPFQHFHAEEHDHDHGQAHAHWAAPHTEGPAWEAPDDAANLMDWLAGDGTTETQAAAEPPSAVLAIALQQQETAAPAPNTRNHDPPAQSALPPRSPPS